MEGGEISDEGDSFDHMAIAMSTDSIIESSLDEDSSREISSGEDSSGESPLELSYESSSFGSSSGDESAPEGVHPFLYEPMTSGDSEDTCVTSLQHTHSIGIIIQ